VPTFCRHGRFLERCPICSKTLPGNAPAGSSSRSAKRASGSTSTSRARLGGSRGEAVRIRRQERAVEDGYASPLLPGVRASADAARFADELAFANGRLLVLSGADIEGATGLLPELYVEAAALAAEDLEQACWICFLSAYLCPLDGPEPFIGIRQALAHERDELEDLDDVPLGPRSSHDPERGAATLDAYRAWYRQAGSQALAFTGEETWSAERRFERLFERLALPGMTRAARYELLCLLGSLGLFTLQADSLHLSGARGPAMEDASTLAAKRIFAIGDPLLLERRARALADAIPVPIAALELALANWQEGERATLGFAPEVADSATLDAARDALAL
jgi:hypothetical protein